MHLFSAVVTLFAFLGCASAFDYCTIKVWWEPEAVNTRCTYKPTDIGAACTSTQYTIFKPNDAEQATILKLHNDLRRKVAQGLEKRGLNGQAQPSAANMRELTWDSELAEMAQTLANQCVYRHDKNRGTQRFPGGAGQNIASSSTAPNRITSAGWEKAINAWYSEVDQVAPSYVDSLPKETPSVIGHYTQVVWAETYAIGCGAVEYMESNGFSTEFVVCNYGPAANLPGAKVYVNGPNASACPNGTKPSNGLCA